MGTGLIDTDQAETFAEIECGGCQHRLPLRLSRYGEPVVVWLCAKCSVPFVAQCLVDRLPAEANTVRLDERYFDTRMLPSISAELKREVAQLASRGRPKPSAEKRRSLRVPQEMVVPAVVLSDDFVPVGDSFQVVVANLSLEGIGLLHEGRIDAEYVVLQLTPCGKAQIQVVVRLVRSLALGSSIYEIGGEFYVRLGGGELSGTP